MLVNILEYLKILKVKLHCRKYKDIPHRHRLESYTVIKEARTPISVSRKVETIYHCKCGYNLDLDEVPEEYLLHLGLKSEKNSIDFVTGS